VQLPLSDLLRQSVYSRLAGYEDVKDAERLSEDPTFRLIGSKKILERGAALNLASPIIRDRRADTGGKPCRAGRAQSGVSRKGRSHRFAARRIVLDMDSTEVAVYGQQEESAYNGHFESTCYHPLRLFNREGDCLAAKLRPGNVHSADGWEELLLPEIKRQQALGKEVVFRADAAFAKPKLYAALEERDLKYAIRLPANHHLQGDDYVVIDPPGGTAEPQAGSPVQRAFSIRQRVGSRHGEWWRRSSSITGSCFPASALS